MGTYNNKHCFSGWTVLVWITISWQLSWDWLVQDGLLFTCLTIWLSVGTTEITGPHVTPFSHGGGYRSPKRSKRGQAPIYKHLLSIWFCHICYCLSGWSKWSNSTQNQCRRDCSRVWIQEENYDHFANNLLQSLRRRLQMTEIQLLLTTKVIAWLTKLKTPSLARFRCSQNSPRI